MDRAQIIDQLAHTTAGFTALLFAALWPNPLTFALAGLCIGFVREITEEGAVSIAAAKAVLASAPSRLDMAFWTVGGFLAGMVSMHS